MSGFQLNTKMSEEDYHLLTDMCRKENIPVMHVTRLILLESKPRWEKYVAQAVRNRNAQSNQGVSTLQERMSNIEEMLKKLLE